MKVIDVKEFESFKLYTISDFMLDNESYNIEVKVSKDSSEIKSVGVKDDIHLEADEIESKVLAQIKDIIQNY